MRVACLILALVVTPAAARTTGTRSLPPVGVLSRVAHDTYGCVDPRAALSITDPTNPKRADPIWLAFMTTRWQCAKMTPYEPWRLVRHQGPLVLLSAARNADQTVPLFVRESDLASSFIEPAPGARPPPAVPVARAVPPPPPRPTTFPDSIAPGPRIGQGYVPDFTGADAPKNGQRASVFDAPRNAAEAYSDAMRAHSIPWTFLLVGGLALVGILIGWLLLRRRFDEAHDT